MSLSKNEIKFLRSLQQKKFRDSEGLFVVEGVKLVEELLMSGMLETVGVYHTNDYSPSFSESVEHREISNGELERISGLKSANKVLALVKKRENLDLDADEDNLILLLDEVKDPGNLGTIIRTADWFGIRQIICSINTTDVYNPKVVQSSMGAIFRVNVIYSDLKQSAVELQEKGFELLCAEMEGEDAFKKSFVSKTALVMGSESHGVSEEIQKLGESITIPRFGNSESLNVGMAAGILMAQYRKS